MGVARQRGLYKAAQPLSTVSFQPTSRISFTTAIVLHSNPAGSGEAHVVNAQFFSSAGSTTTITIGGIASTIVLAANGSIANREWMILPGQTMTVSAGAATIIDCIVKKVILV